MGMGWQITLWCLFTFGGALMLPLGNLALLAWYFGIPSLLIAGALIFPLPFKVSLYLKHRFGWWNLPRWLFKLRKLGCLIGIHHWASQYRAVLLNERMSVDDHLAEIKKRLLERRITGKYEYIGPYRLTKVRYPVSNHCPYCLKAVLIRWSNTPDFTSKLEKARESGLVCWVAEKPKVRESSPTPSA